MESRSYTVSLLPQLVEYLVLCRFPSPPCYKSLLLFSDPSLSQPLAHADAPQYSGWSEKEVHLLASVPDNLRKLGTESLYSHIPASEVLKAESSLLTLNCTSLG